MKTAVHFGADDFDREFIGRMLRRAGYRVVFADINPKPTDSRESRTKNAAERGEETGTVPDAIVLAASDPELDEWIARAETVTLAAGAASLPGIAPSLARGVGLRRAHKSRKALNILILEDGSQAAPGLRAQVRAYLDPALARYADRYVTFDDCAAGPTAAEAEAETGDAAAPEYSERTANGPGTKKPRPRTPLADGLDVYARGISSALEIGGATAAYLGYRKGYPTVARSMADGAVRRIVGEAIRESGAALTEEFGLAPHELDAYVQRTVSRLDDPDTCGDIETVCRNPLRKLAPGERLVRSALEAERLGLPRYALAAGIAAALRYDNPDDAESTRIQGMIADTGVRIAASEITGIDAGSRLMDTVAEAYAAIPFLAGQTAETAEAPAGIPETAR